MINKIFFEILLLFSFFYPLSFWVTHDNIIKRSFLRFNLSLICLSAAFGLWYALSLKPHSYVALTYVVWIAAVFFIAFQGWYRECLWQIPWTLTSFVGIAAFLASSLPQEREPFFVLNVFFDGGILAISLFAMILGHWYLNMKKLSTDYLMRASKVFWALVLVRFLCHIFQLIYGHTIYMGDTVILWRYLMTYEGFFLNIGILFGTLFPAFMIFFVVETIRIKSTQSATGLLYVLSISTLLSVPIYHYYAVIHNIFI